MNRVREFYQDAQREWDRLDLPLCRIEFASTLALIDQYFTEGMTVFDIGGGPGRYTIELIKRGCKVTLLDISPENIALAKTKISEIGLAAEGLLVGDARDLSRLTDQYFDGILTRLAPQTDEACFGCGSDRRFMTSSGRTRLR